MAENLTLEKPSINVSVVIPVYNSAAYLKECLISVLGQSEPVYELVVVDDGSTDSTSEIVTEFLAKYPKIRYLRKRNGGPASARNLGITASSGNYIALIDSDDIWKPNKMKSQLKYMNLQEADMSICSLDLIDSKGSLMGEKINDFDGPILEGVALEKIGLMTPTLVFKKSIIEGWKYCFDEKLHFFEDYEFISRLSKNGKYVFLPDRLVQRRVHLDSTSSTINVENYKASLLRFLSLINGEPKQVFDKISANGFFALGYHLLFRLELVDARRYLKVSLGYRFRAKTFVLYLCSFSVKLSCLFCEFKGRGHT
jgi:glycosyltransferase involved in cell wall biosynthesis